LHKEKHLDICKRLLDCYGAEGDNFLERIITGDETWNHHYETESKHQSMNWKHRHSPTKEKFKTHSAAGKLMLTVFGILSRDGLNNEHCSLQCDELKPAIRNQRRGMLSESVVFLHDNDCPHAAIHTVETLKKLNYEVLEHPLYSLDLTPSDSPVWST
jgi:histone-lysine N-methyltransferase SETMAR